MFTGLIEAVGSIVEITGALQRTLVIACPEAWIAETQLGDSVAMNGCCLTVVHINTALSLLHFEIGTETCRVTTLGNYTAGMRVNLERAMRLSDRLGGHLVSGHIDGVGQIQSMHHEQNVLYVHIQAPTELMRFIADRGSITVDGVSLTVTGVTEQTFQIGLIPHTLQVTTLGDLRVGQAVNLEVDMLARYVARLLPASA